MAPTGQAEMHDPHPVHRSASMLTSERPPNAGL